MLSFFSTSSFFAGFSLYLIDHFSSFSLKLFLVPSEKKKAADKVRIIFNLDQQLCTFFSYKRFFSSLKFFSVFDGFILRLLFTLESSKNYLNPVHRILYRTYQSNTGLYMTLQTDASNKKFKNVTYFLLGLKSTWVGIRFWFLSLIIGLFIFYSLMAFRFVPLLKISFQWLCIVMFLY